jgi:hypothetical protein
MKMKIRNWDPAKGDCQQGDVLLFRIPDSIQLSSSEEIEPKANRLILAEGEITGHHHAIWLPKPAMFRDDGLAREMEVKAPAATIKLYRDAKAVEALVHAGEIEHGRLAIGFLVIAGGPAVLRHDEHDGVRIPPGRYYVGGQFEWDAAAERRVQD